MDRRMYEAIKYEFKPDEITTLGVQLAREEQTAIDLRDKKASVSAEFTAKIKAVEQRIGEIADKINNGYEMREVECMVMLDSPKMGMKQIIRIDTNKVERTEAMTLSEMQRDFGFNDGEDQR